jgi:cytosine/adenosine deaminase-related metal-dependent hydrolase
MPGVALSGEVVTFDAAPIADGTVYVDEDGRIAAVRKRGERPPAGFDDARRVETQGAIYPGLIDLHNHIAYNTLPLWSPPERTEPYASREQWPRDASYAPMVSHPVQVLGRAAGKALLKYVEVKALVGGVTAIQGSAKTTPYEGWLVRNVEVETFGTGKRGVYQSVRTLSSEEDFEKARERMKAGAPFLYHLSEGTSPKLLREYDDLREHRCLGPRLLAIHATALGPAQYEEWGRRGGSVIWSPFSNLWLYRGTSDVRAAVEHGIGVCLGADWSPSGSKSLLGELKVADLWNRTALEGAFDDEALCRMATTNAADALGWEDEVGRVRKGLRADLLVVGADRKAASPYRRLIEATEGDVELVMVGGRPVYGTADAMRAAGAGPQLDPVTVGGAKRRLSLVDPAVRDADMRWDEVVGALEAVRRNPAKAVAEAERRGAAAVRVVPDMPWDDPAAVRAPADPAKTKIPPLDSLAHDDEYLGAVERAPILGGLLDDLRSYYRR